MPLYSPDCLEGNRLKRGGRVLIGTLARMRKPYSTDLSEAEWSCLEEHLAAPENGGRPRIHSLREILNAIFYIV